MTTIAKPNCYACKFRRNVPGDAHSECTNRKANVTADPHGVQNGWCFWPINYDPIWLYTCDGYVEKPKDEHLDNLFPGVEV